MKDETGYTDSEGRTYDSSGNKLIDMIVMADFNWGRSNAARQDSGPKKKNYGSAHKFQLRDFDFRDGRGHKRYLERNGWDSKTMDEVEPNMKSVSRAFISSYYTMVAPVIVGVGLAGGILYGTMVGLQSLIK